MQPGKKTTFLSNKAPHLGHIADLHLRCFTRFNIFI